MSKVLTRPIDYYFYRYILDGTAIALTLGGLVALCLKNPTVALAPFILLAMLIVFFGPTRRMKDFVCLSYEENHGEAVYHYKKGKLQGCFKIIDIESIYYTLITMEDSRTFYRVHVIIITNKGTFITVYAVPACRLEKSHGGSFFEYTDHLFDGIDASIIIECHDVFFWYFQRPLQRMK